MLQIYQNIQSGCATLSLNLQDKCTSDTLNTYKQDFIAYCQSKEQTCRDQANQHPDDPDAYANCMRGFTSEGYSAPDGGLTVWKKSELEQDAEHIFFDEHGGFNTENYFPGVDWAHSLWLDGSVGN